MNRVTLSPKYQMVIPKEAREKLHLRGGQKITVIVHNGLITLVPDRPLESLRGITDGIDWRDIREKTDRL